MDTFLKANNSKNKDLRVWNLWRDEEDVVVTSSGIPLSIIILFLKVICILQSVHHDVVGILSQVKVVGVYLGGGGGGRPSYRRWSFCQNKNME